MLSRRRTDRDRFRYPRTSREKRLVRELDFPSSTSRRREFNRTQWNSVVAINVPGARKCQVVKQNILLTATVSVFGSPNSPRDLYR